MLERRHGRREPGHTGADRDEVGRVVPVAVGFLGVRGTRYQGGGVAPAAVVVRKSRRLRPPCFLFGIC